MAVLSVLELPNRRTTRETKAESLTAGSSLLETSGTKAAAEAPGLGAGEPGDLADDKHLIDGANKWPFSDSTCKTRK
jgi:hypothetical protein